MLRHFAPLVCLLVIAAAAGCTHEQRTAAAADAAAENGYHPLFNGKDLFGWFYAKNAKGALMKTGNGYQVRDDGVLFCTATDGGRLMTEKQYSNFAVKFDFKLEQNSNNGIAIRAAEDGNPAYRGMEIQILDDSGPQYHSPRKEIRAAQYHGSIYDVVPAAQGHQRPVGEWNEEEIIADGHHIKVILNGATIVDANLADIKDEAVLAKHPGLKYPTGHIGLLGHGSAVEFRNFRIKEL
jgi:hypothetical protein